MPKCIMVYPWEIIEKLREGKQVKCFDILNEDEYTLPDMWVCEMFDLIEEINSCDNDNRFVIWYIEYAEENEEGKINESND